MMFRVSIRTRLFTGFILIALFSTIAVSISSLVPAYHNSQQAVLERVSNVAALRAAEIANWYFSVEADLNAVLSEEYATERFQVILSMGAANTFYDFYVNAARNRFQLNISRSPTLEYIALLDANQRVLLDTQHPYTGVVLSQACLQSQSDFCLIHNGDDPAIQIMRPVQAGNQIGFAAVIVDPAQLLRILTDTHALGETGKSYLLFVTGAGEPFPLTEVAVLNARPVGLLSTRSVGTEAYLDLQGNAVIGAYHWIPQIGGMLFVEQAEQEAYANILTTLTANLGVTLVALIFAISIAFITARLLTRPLHGLAQTTADIAAGNFGVIPYTKRVDEIGTLARSFDTMMLWLRDMINTLENRVIERTHDLEVINERLEHRARQLETSARVSHQISSLLTIDDLLTKVVWLIKESFKAYHVHVFLLDESLEILQLRASTAVQQHHIRMDAGGLNSMAIRTKEAVFAADVHTDRHYLQDQLLPETRSELVVPLHVGNRVIGTLDVMSQQTNAYSAEDILVMQGLGDQIATAIENARLYENTRRLAVLEERTRLARDLHDSVTQSVYSLHLLSEGWRRLIVAGQIEKAPEYLIRVNEITAQVLLELRMLIFELQPSLLESDGLIAAIQERLRFIEDVLGVQVVVSCDDPLPLSSSLAAALYWIAREALNNIVKHAYATHINVRLHTTDDVISMEIEDNGCGFVPEHATSRTGLGLQSMHQRIMDLGGTLRIVSTPNLGTTIIVRISTAAPL